MKIGQLTFHASHNYGSVLQAYALSRELQLLGHETEFINLRPTAQREAYRIIRENERGIHRAFHYLIYPALKRRYDEYERFITQVLPIGNKEYQSTEELRAEHFSYDAYVCGGDQIWNPACQDFETAYYLQFLGADDPARKIAYAPSFGKAEIDEETMRQIGEWARCFDTISVREERGAGLLREYVDKPVRAVCDPVLLLDRREWERLAVPPRFKKPYILAYFLENNHGSRGLIEYLQKTLGYEVVIFNEYLREFLKPYHKVYGASPEEFVGLFLNASFVYTNSFHGTAFATLFEKPFLTAIAADQKNARNNNDSRKIDYLTRLSLEERLYQTGQPDPENLLALDFTTARERLQRFRDDSLDYLVTALS